MANIYLKKLKGGSKEIWEMKCVFFFFFRTMFSVRDQLLLDILTGKRREIKKKL